MDSTPDTRKKHKVVGSDKQPLEVYLRVRPLVKEEKEQGQTKCIQSEANDAQITITAPENQSYSHQNETEMRFEFTRVFQPEDGQETVFAHTGQPLVQQFLEGKNCLLFAYGNTNAGKTFTINGSESEPGVLPRMLEMLFVQLLALQKDPKFDYHILATYCEIYNETLVDLLAWRKDNQEKVPLDIKEDKVFGMYVAGLKEERLTSPEDGRRLLQLGQQNRKVAETALNHDSSRSHSMFTLKLIRIEKGGNLDEKRATVLQNRLSIVDLAGSERAKRTQNTGARLKEAASINTSLMTFGRVVAILRENQNLPPHLQQVAPFRESKLTRLVQDFFLVSGRAMMIVNVTPAARDYDETLHVLKFSALAKEVCTSSRPAKRKLVEPDTPSHAEGRVPRTPLSRPARSDASSELREEIQDLKMKLIERESQMGRMEMAIRNECANFLAERLIEMETRYKERLQRYESMADDKYQRKMLIWSDTLKLCQMPSETEKCESRLQASQEVCESLQAQLQEREKELTRVRRLLEAEEASKAALTQKLQLQLELHEAMERDTKSHCDSAVRERTRELEARCQNLEMQLSQKTLQLERLTMRNRELEQQRRQDSGEGRSPIPKIVVTPPKEKGTERTALVASSPASFINSSLSCDEEVVSDGDIMSDVSLDSPPRKEKRKRILPRVMNAKKKLCTVKKKNATKEGKGQKPEVAKGRKRSISCPNLDRLAEEGTTSRHNAAESDSHRTRNKADGKKAKLLKELEDNVSSPIHDLSPIMTEVASPKRRHSSLFFSSEEKENTPENSPAPSPAPSRKPKALFSMKVVDEPTGEATPKSKKGDKKAKETLKGKIQKKTSTRTILNRKAKAPSYLQKLKKPGQV